MTDAAKEVITDLAYEMGRIMGETIVKAVEAEEEKEKAAADASQWYEFYQKKDADLKEAQQKLSDEIAEHQRTRDALREALDTAREKGAKNNG